MTEFLYDDNKPIDPKNYRVKLGCINCEEIRLMDIIKGKAIDVFLSKEKIKCPQCECLETLVSYNTFKAQKAMMNQIMQMAKQEEEMEGKNLGHYK